MAEPSNLELVKVTKRYGATLAVDSIDLRVPAGAYCCLLGPSGCGKTSTLRMIAGHESASSGDILLGDANVTDLPPAKRGTAMMFQSYALFPHLTCVDNVAFSLKMRGVDKAARRERAMEFLELVAMSALRRARAGAAFRRPAAARRAGARADHRAAGAAARRAAVGARHVPARAHAHRTEAAANQARHPVHPCHARPGRGAGARRSRRRDEQGQDRAGGLGARRVRDVRRPNSSPASSAATTSSARRPASIAVRADRTRLARNGESNRSCRRPSPASNTRARATPSRSKAAARRSFGDRRRRRVPATRRSRSATASASSGARRTFNRFLPQTEQRAGFSGGIPCLTATKLSSLSRRDLLKTRRRACRRQRARLVPGAGRMGGGGEGAALPRHRGQPIRRHHQEGEGRDRHHHPEHRRHHRRRHQARHHPAELVRHSRHRIFQPEEAGAVGQHPGDGRQEDQGIRQYHADLHQGPVAQRQGDRRPGHRAEEGDVRRGRALHEVLEDADRMGDADPDRLQRRHARHPPRPHQAADQFLGRIAEPGVQGQGGDPQHSLDRHHGRRDGGRGDRQIQISRQGKHDRRPKST